MTTTTTVLLPYVQQVNGLALKDIVYILGGIAGILVALIGALAWSRFRYQREQSVLTANYVEQQGNFIGALKAEAAHYRAQTAVMEKELCAIKERLAREMGELRGQMASLERILHERCRYYQQESPTDPGCIFCQHPGAWGRQAGAVEADDGRKT